MTWETRPSTVDDAAYVYEHLWDRGSVELAALGIGREEWTEACRLMIEEDSCSTLVRNGRPVAIAGVEKVGQFGLTRFQATTEFNAELRGLSRHLCRIMSDLAGRFDVRAMVLDSLCVSPEAPSWYRFLGFKEDNTFRGPECAGRQVRRFVRVWG